MNISHFRLRSLTSIVSLTTVGLFLFFYLGFNYFWSHDKATEQAIALQQGENERVQTLFEIKKTELESWTSDYAAWNQLIAYINHTDDTFITDSFNTHTLTSNGLDAFSIYDKSGKLVRGQAYDYEHQSSRDTGYFDIYMQPVLALLTQQQTDTVHPLVDIIVLQHQPYLVSASRVCNSEGFDCNHGYLIFLKMIRQGFLDEISHATGLSVRLQLSDVHDEVSVIHEHKKVHPNTSYIPVHNSLNGEHLLIVVSHNVALPNFLDWQEITALGLFSLFMFVVFLFVTSMLVKPITTAHQVITNFKTSGGKMPRPGSFYSKEMQEFSKSVNGLIEEFEASRAELQWQSDHDPLTRIANRRRLEKIVKEIIYRRKQPYLMVFLVDIDHFKRYNDHYGHIMGDFALQRVAKALEQVEFVGKKIVARFGGEEFCVVCASEQLYDANQFAGLLRQAVVDLDIEHDWSPTKPILSISIGGVVIVAPVLKYYLSYFHHADVALYQAKESGRDRWHIKTYHYRKGEDNYAGLDLIR